MDYAAVQSGHLDEERLRSFFAPKEIKQAIFPNAQNLTLEGLEGRVLSSSYMPQPGNPRYKEMYQAIEELFNSEQQGGHVRMEYECAVTYAQLNTQ